MDRKTFLGQSSMLILGSAMMNPFMICSNAVANYGSTGNEKTNSLTLFLAGDVMTGRGDLINDYEGIGGHEKYRPNLRLMYFPRLREDGTLDSLQMIPMKMHRFQLQRASEEAEGWLAEVLDRQCERYGHSVELSEDGRLYLHW